MPRHRLSSILLGPTALASHYCLTFWALWSFAETIVGLDSPSIRRTSNARINFHLISCNSKGRFAINLSNACKSYPYPSSLSCSIHPDVLVKGDDQSSQLEASTQAYEVSDEAALHQLNHFERAEGSAHDLSQMRVHDEGWSRVGVLGSHWEDF